MKIVEIVFVRELSASTGVLDILQQTLWTAAPTYSRSNKLY